MQSLIRLFLISLSLCLAAIGGSAEPDQRLRNAVQSLIEDHKGEVSVAIEHLETGEFFQHRADRVMPTASLIKLPLLIVAYQMAAEGELDLDQRIELKSEDKVPGSGLLTDHIDEGVALRLRDYLRLMIRYSDNTATNVVATQIGLKQLADRMDALEFPETKMNSLTYRRGTSIAPQRSELYGLGSTTAGETVRLLALLHRGKLADEEVTKEITEHLLVCDDDSKLARYLPPGIKLAHKTGAIANCRTDAGIFYTDSGPVAVCVLTNKNEDQRWSDDNAANRLIANIGKAVVQRFGADSKDQPMQQGAVGKLVEALQRTLNKRLKPSPGLAIDGDFGPATRGAVERFQEQQKLPVTGIVGKETWQQLGPLIERDDPIPDPDVVNAEVLPMKSRPPLDGPPIVTCKAWVIGDSEGNVLWESAGSERLEPASTTKVMTAYVVLQLAERQPGLLDETLTFSERADRTVGSTSGIRAGESLTVRECLYGLLLPSGNDASVALAEFCGQRLGEPSDDESSYDSFIAAMNQAADELGMSNSTYQNTHGLPDAEHKLSAIDLLRLATAAMKYDLFREIVSTRQFGCRVESEEGYARNVIWKNTNRLLAIEGFSGVKTGTTRAAGACLVSRGKFGEDEYTVVILGSSSSDARYADTRNLYRWAARNKDRQGASGSLDDSESNAP